jgi:hypothetical protein
VGSWSPGMVKHWWMVTISMATSTIKVVVARGLIVTPSLTMMGQPSKVQWELPTFRSSTATIFKAHEGLEVKGGMGFAEESREEEQKEEAQ